MRLPRLRFTLRQLIKLIAVCAAIFAVIRTPLWPALVATGLVLPGFACDRRGGGSGILGAMLSGIVGFIGCGFALNAYSYLSGQGGFLILDSLGSYVMLAGLIGLAWGTVVGFWCWLILLLLGRAIRWTRPKVESVGPIHWSGFEDRGLPHPRAEGR